MASIFKRKYPTGYEVTRVTIRRKDYPVFCISFDDWDEACLWVFDNEKAYMEDPSKYFKWRESVYYKQRKEDKDSRWNVMKLNKNTRD